MPTFRFTSPEGKKYRVDAPDGTTPEQAYTQLQNQMQPEMPTTSPMENLARSATDIPRYLGNAGLSIMQGVNDLPIGVAQLATHLPFVPDSAGQAVDDYIKYRDQKYSELRGDDGGLNVGRVTGNVLTSLPFAARVPAQSLVGRMVQGGKSGALVGATSPVDPESNFWTSKVVQTGLGGGLGFIGTPVVETLFKGASAAVNALSGKLRGMLGSSDQVSQAVSNEMSKAGVDWDSLNPNVRTSVVAEIEKALSSGKPIDPESISRLADFKALNIEPTLGQITRDPKQFTLEQNLAKRAIGGRLSSRLNEQNQGLLSSLPASPVDDYAAGETAIKSLQTADAARKANVDDLYTAARSQAGIETKVPMQPISQKLGELVENFGSDKLPGAVAKRLNEYGVMGGAQTKVFNLREAEKLRQLITNNLDPMNKPQSAFLTQLRGSIDEAVNGLADQGDQIGATAAQAFGKARAAAADRFSTIDSAPGIKAVLAGDVKPETFVRDFVLRGGVDDVKNLFAQLDPNATGAMRSQVIGYLRQQATGGASDEVAAFSQKSFNDALTKIGDRKLSTIFTPQDVELLKRVGRVASYTTKAPIGSAVNYSNSAITMLDAMDGMAKVPLLSPIIGKPADLYRSHQANAALSGALTMPSAPMSGVLAGPVFGSIPGILSR